jgi:molybdopterin/thiamine biosynthesis adenylyltransferase
MITIAADLLAKATTPKGEIHFNARRQDDSESYSTIKSENAAERICGTIRVTDNVEKVKISEIGKNEDIIRIIIQRPEKDKQAKNNNSSHWNAEGYVLHDGKWHKTPVAIVPIRDDLYSRSKGLFETPILADKTVFIAGLGSIGSLVGVELAKLGIKNFILLDYDRIEVVNVVRHQAGISDVGRLKVNYMADAIHEKNPYANIEICGKKIAWDTQEIVREFIERSDLAICAADGHEGRVIFNKECIKTKTPSIFVGAFRRAHGGQILWVNPGQGPCYQCFLQSMPEFARNQEIASEDHAQQLAYSDRPVAVEPGLSNDIMPLSQMVVKLSITHLLKNQSTTLRSLEEDLIAPWYIWVNRREAGTDYESLEPLEFNVDGFCIMRWYGIDFKKIPECPCCGDPYAAMAKKAEMDFKHQDNASVAHDKNSQ